MLLSDERSLIVEYGKRMLDRGLVESTGGNLSIYSREKALVVISPSGVPYETMTPGDVSVVDLDKKVVEGSRRPSSELDMHLVFYKNRQDISAMVHTHSVYATTLACLRKELPPVHYLIGFAGKTVRCADYALFGTPELAENAYAAMQHRNAVLLANHGLLAGSTDIDSAFTIAELIEYCAEVYYRACSIGEPVVLSDDEMSHVLEKFRDYIKK